MRIGELLVEQRKLDRADLERALAEKPADTRLCSFLIARGLVELDDASRALGEQKRIACALSKHLAGRDPALAKLISAELGRGSCALPIGRTSKGSIIVCVRDPSPAIFSSLEQAIPGDVMMVIAPADRLQRLVAEAYGKAPTGELDIDLDVPHTPRRPLTTPPIPFPRALTPPPLPPLPEMDALDPASVRDALIDLDDARVSKDLSQNQLPGKTGSTLPPRPATLPPRPKTLPPPDAFASGTERPTRPMSLELMSVGLDSAPNREAATDLVLAYVATRWECGLVLAIRDKAAIGYRGHAVSAPELVTVSLGSPSTVQRAFQTRDVSLETPAGVGQSALKHALNNAKAPAAAPILVAGQPVAILAVGDPIGGHDHGELKVLADALGAAYQRIHAR
jgi:hypothetical protein